jgi:hypothetical protein
VARGASIEKMEGVGRHVTARPANNNGPPMSGACVDVLSRVSSMKNHSHALNGQSERERSPSAGGRCAQGDLIGINP